MLLTKGNKNFWKPENILLDFDVGTKSGEKYIQTNKFEMIISDWGSAGENKEHFVGTPVYASPKAFEQSQHKDIAAFCTLALEIYFEKQGKCFRIYF